MDLSSQVAAPKPHVSLSRSDLSVAAFLIEIKNPTANALSLDRMSPETTNGDCKAKLDAGEILGNKSGGLTGGRYYAVGPHAVWQETVQLRRAFNQSDPAVGERRTQFLTAPQLTTGKHAIAFSCFGSEWSDDVPFNWSER